MENSKNNTHKQRGIGGDLGSYVTSASYSRNDRHQRLFVGPYIKDINDFINKTDIEILPKKVRNGKAK